MSAWRAGSAWPVIIRRRVISRRVIVGRRPRHRPDRGGDDHRGGADDRAHHAERPKQWERRGAGRITPPPSWIAPSSSRARNEVRRGLSAGGRWIRTLGPSQKGSAGKVEQAASTSGSFSLGPRVRIRLPPAVSQVRTAIARRGTSHSSAEAGLGAIFHRGDRGFESTSPQQPVCLSSEP
jgi:hypothetical protein